ncbi:MAG: hypothetical protein H0X37_20300 [Herpetosiphonaceae bacterium]|nr:hypothetical protein [Herpetosiphonaceae bacterium]
MGLIARTIEAAGIPTVSIMLLREIAEKVKAPRTLLLRWPFGHPLGEPGNRAQQLTVLHAALTLLVEATVPGTIAEPGYRWRREHYTEPGAWPAGITQ